MLVVDRNGGDDVGKDVVRVHHLMLHRAFRE